VATDPRERLGEFAGYLREHGFALGYAEVQLMTRAASALPPSQWSRIAALWRAIAAGSRRQWLQYPELHQAFWFPSRVRGSTRIAGVTRRGRTLPELVEQLHADCAQANPPQADPARHTGIHPGQGAEQGEEAQRAQGGASRAEALEQRDFADWTPRDVDRFQPLVEAFQRRLRALLLRRWQPAGGRRIHLRRSLRGALGTAGELVKLHHMRRQRRMPELVLFVDVSRSMETHAQFFLSLARTFVEVADARAFVFHTRLAEVTALLKRRSGRAQEKINAMTVGFGGGTRIASCLQDAQRHLAGHLRRGDLVLVFSDGYDTDEPQALGLVLAQMQARGARICWLHPSVKPPESMALNLARAHIDRFMPAHNLASLSRLPRLLN